MEKENLKEEIKKKLKQIEQMIQEGKKREEIETERKKLDSMLEEYVKHI